MKKIGARERKRLLKMHLHEERLRAQGYAAIAGIDEAGRGPLAGPVVAAACILPPGFLLAFLNDSKQLTPILRASLFDQLTKNPEVYFGIGIVSETRIDEVNILRANLEAMQIAVQNLTRTPDYLIVDGDKLPSTLFPSEALVKGDTLSLSIAAASVIAKVTRDRIMEEEAKKWPEYGFEQHKGYRTLKHLEQLHRLGPCPLHRKSFNWAWQGRE